MRRSLAQIILSVSALIAGGVSPASPAVGEDKPRIKTILASSQEFIDDLRFLVVDLGKEERQWENNLLPSIEIFLLGVDYNKPVMWDALVNTPAEGDPPGYRYQPAIPIARDGRELRTFIRENLVPIGINARLRQRDYYLLTGNVFEGTMRVVGDRTKDYVTIAAKGFESDIPPDMPHPIESHSALLNKGYDVGMELINTVDQIHLRRLQADDLLAHFMKNVQRKPDETQAEFEFRNVSQRQTYEQMHRLYVEAQELTVGWTTDVPNKRGEAEFVLRALPETSLHSYLATMGAEPSHFAALAMPQDPVLGLRANLPLDEFRRKQLDVWYPLARDAAKSNIDSSETFTAAQKDPAKQATDLLFDMLIAGQELGRIDLFVEITTAGSSHHALVSGIRASNGKAADDIVKLLPQIQEGWKVQMDVETVGDTAIHAIDASADVANAMTEFFGPSRMGYVGTSANVVWIAAGEGSLEKLKAAISRLAEGAGGGASADPATFVELTMQAGPLIAFSDDLAEETGFSLTDSINIKPPAGPTGTTGEGRTGLQPIDPKEMRDIIRRSLTNIQDRVTGVVRRQDDSITGKMTFDPGVLRSVGKIIAKVAEDNL